MIDARTQLVATCRTLRAEGLVVGTAGNVSVRLGDLVAVSPSGLDYDDLTPDWWACTGSTGHLSTRR